jgi:GT2 family glycosyltransferase
MNTDIKLEQAYFQHLLQYFEAKDTFAVMGKILAWEDDTIQDTAKYPDVSFWSINGTRNYLIETDNSQKEATWQYSFFSSGANMLANRNKLVELGGFNHLFSPYYG